MASTIGTSAAYTSVSMKPASGEQLDALWGQNVADNTGYVWHKVQQVHIPISSGVNPTYLFLFTKLPGQTTLSLKVRGDNTGSAAAVTDAINIYPDGQSTTAGTASLTFSHAYTRGVNTTNVYTMDITSLTDNSHYVLKFAGDTTKTFHAPSLYLA